jgi:ribonuclease T2
LQNGAALTDWSFGMRPASCRRSFAAVAGSILMMGLLVAPDHAARSAEDEDCILDHCADQIEPGPEPKAVSQPKAAPKPVEAKPDPANDIQPPPQPASEPDVGAQPRGPSRSGSFDFYVLSLSWSPGFCATSGGRSYSQCQTGANLGFVVHGLWPQYEHGYPSDCRTSAAYPSRTAVESAHGLYPDDGLARYEWRRHGTCSGKSPSDYFADVRRAREAVTIPQPFQTANEQQSWVPFDIERAFIAANPHLKAGMVAVACRRGMLEEVRICFTKDLRDFQACPEVVHADCRVPNISVPPMR